MFKKLKSIGPAAMVAAAFIGPGTVTTATIAGASYGYTLLWAITFSLLATFILQEMAARLGLIAQMGLGQAIRTKTATTALKTPALLLVISAILIGNTAYEAGNISGAVFGISEYTQSNQYPINPLLIIIGGLAAILLYTGNYKRIERTLVVMVSLMGFVFLAAAIAIQPDWGKVIRHAFTPHIPQGSLLMIVGLIGTTIVPYNLFLHASAVKKKWSGEEALSMSRWDTLISIILGGLITMAILISASVAFEGQNDSVNNASQLAQQLEPLLGAYAPLFISLGFLFAGLSSAITAPLAAAFATSEMLNWKEDMNSWKFRAVCLSILLIGLIFSSLGFKPTAVILFAQIANGLLLPIVAIFLVWIMNDKQIMGKHSNSLPVNIAAILVILITLMLGTKGILAALNVI